MPHKIPFVEAALSRARALETRGEYAQAEAIYLAVLDKFPSDKRAGKCLKAVRGMRAGRHQAVSAAATPGKAQISELVNLYNQGRLQEALYRGSVLADNYPAAALLQNILGAVHARMGSLQEAVDCYQKALALKPTYAEAHNNLGNVLSRLGRQDDAVASFGRALSVMPEYPEAHNNLGSVFNQMGRFKEAATCYTKALQIRPGYAEAHNGLGNALRDLDEPEEALSHFDAAIRISPDFSQAHKNRGDTLRSLGKLEDAIRSYKQAIRLKPDYPEPYVGLGLILNDLGRHHQAIDSIKMAIQLRPTLAVAHSSLGNVLGEIGLHEEAMTSYRAALDIDPDCAEVLVNMGISLCEFGRHDEAIACYTRALQLKPDFPEAHNNLSRLKTYTKDDPHFAEIQQRLTNPDLSEHERMHLSFALGKAYEDLGDVDLSFNYLLQGNQLRKKTSGYNINTDRVEFEQIKLLFNAENAAGIAESRTVLELSQQPIFIVGMPRSGTTLTEQILASHSRVTGCGELEALGRILNHVPQQTAAGGEKRLRPEALLGYRDAYLNELAGRPGDTPFLTDKMPSNFKWIGFLLTVMPGVKIIHMQRDPVAVCWSMFKLQFRGHGYSNDMADLAGYYRLYLDLMEFWRKEFPGQFYDLDYQALTRNQEQETRKLLEYCELGWEDQCLEFYKTPRAVRTLSAKQVRQKMYTGSSEAWRQYEAHLQPLIEALKG
jgi:tetratricopeptide (TPR) repeat protein